MKLARLVGSTNLTFYINTHGRLLMARSEDTCYSATSSTDVTVFTFASGCSTDIRHTNRGNVQKSYVFVVEQLCAMLKDRSRFRMAQSAPK